MLLNQYGNLRKYTFFVLLAHFSVIRIHRDIEGKMWFGWGRYEKKNVAVILNKKGRAIADPASELNRLLNAKRLLLILPLIDGEQYILR